MKKRLILGPSLLVGGVLALLLLARRDDGPAERWEALPTTRGDAVAVLRETGTLAPRDPLVVPVPFDGKLQWVVEDATWVAKGEPLFIISDDDELKKVADERQQLEEARQDHDLGLLKLAQAVETEQRKVQKAHDDLVLEEARNRILTAPAKGGLELVELDRQLRPQAERTAAVRATADGLRDAWQTAQDAYLDRLDLWQQHQDDLLRQENRLDELTARAREDQERPADAARRRKREERGQNQPKAEAGKTAGAKHEQLKADPVKPAPAQPAQAKPEPAKADPPAAGGDDAKPADPAAEREQVLAERARLAALTPALQADLAAARAARDAATAPRDAAEADLRRAEDDERELRIRIEIEKRRLPATQLELDLRLAEIASAEADRRLAEGDAAFKAQVISRAAHDDLLAGADQERTDLATTRERLALAARPPGPEVLAEAAARLAKAQQAAAQAEEVRTRNLEIQRQGIAVLDAKIARLGASLAVRARRFASTIEQEIAARQRDRTLHPEDAARLDGEIAGLTDDLAKARSAPPNVLLAAVSGLVKVRREGDRQKLAGDQVYQADPMCEVYPPEHMEVVVRVNEVNVPKLRQGMRVRAEVPALGRLPRSGVIAQVAGVGRDKNDLLGRKGMSGVTQYEARIVLDPGADGRDGDFRQGMTALVEIELSRTPGALLLPRGAVEPLDGNGAWGVRRAAGAMPTAISGHPLGDDAFVVEGGLRDGERVFVRRVTNR